MDYKVGDKVFVIDWGKQYSKFHEWINQEKVLCFNWKTEIPQYAGPDHHWKYEYEPNLTLKGTINKREPTKLKSKTPVYKNYKYEILEITKHPKAGEFIYDNEEQREKWGYDKISEEPIYLIASTHEEELWRKCFVQISGEGLSFLTPKQFADEQFNALKEYHKGKWTINMKQKASKDFPKELLGVVYDTNDNVLFGCHYVKGKVQYFYIPGEYTNNGNPFITHVSVAYDGKGNSDIPKDSIVMHFSELKNMFPDNTFSG